MKQPVTTWGINSWTTRELNGRPRILIRSDVLAGHSPASAHGREVETYLTARDAAFLLGAFVSRYGADAVRAAVAVWEENDGHPGRIPADELRGRPRT